MRPILALVTSMLLALLLPTTAQAGDAGAPLAAKSRSWMAGKTHFFTTSKIDASGKKQWTRRAGGLATEVNRVTGSNEEQSVHQYEITPGTNVKDGIGKILDQLAKVNRVFGQYKYARTSLNGTPFVVLPAMNRSAESRRGAIDLAMERLHSAQRERAFTNEQTIK